jgi:hypothetical protein
MFMVELPINQNTAAALVKRQMHICIAYVSNGA